MKELYIECNMGVAGDMLCGALLDTLDDNEKNDILNRVNSFLNNVNVSSTKTNKCGISGTKLNVEIERLGHTHTTLDEIYDIIDSFEINDTVKNNAKAIYEIIAEAESIVHGEKVADVHLHEVGATDAIIDITTFCYLIDYLNIEKISSSTIVTGYGEVNTAHGVLPVPAPATAQILKGVPNEVGDIKSELTTPTGAGIVKHFVKSYDDKPSTYDAIGYGMGSKDFEKPNCVRVFISNNDYEDITELRCQIDDMTGEEIGFAINKMLELGALDAFVKPITMKKSRPAFEFCVITKPKQKEYFTTQMFKHTTSLGIRQIECKRAKLDREIIEKNGIKVKRSTGYGVTKEKIEFDDLAKLANEKDISIFEARKLVK